MRMWPFTITSITLFTRTIFLNGSVLVKKFSCSSYPKCLNTRFRT